MTDKEQKEKIDEFMKQLYDEQKRLHPEIYEPSKDKEVVNK